MSLDIDLIAKYHVSHDGCKTFKEKEEYVFEGNITHNLGEMADKAGIYEAIWRPYRLFKGYNPKATHEEEYAFEDSTPVYAKDIVKIVAKGLKKLKARPKYYRQFDSPNGWGMYDHFVPFVEKYYNALKEYPNAKIKISR